MLQTLTFVTQNKNKLADAQQLLPDFTIEHIDFEVPEIQSLDPREIVSHKLVYAYEKIQKPCFVMDASLFWIASTVFLDPLLSFGLRKP